MELKDYTVEELYKERSKSDSKKSKSNNSPKSYFYCKYGGIAPICSHCKRNHINSEFQTDDIDTWYIPQANASFKQCKSHIN